MDNQVNPHIVEALRQAVQQVQPPQQQQPQARGNGLLRILMMLAQGADSVNTANFLRKPGTFETDPLMRPFAQPGNPLPMMGAYGAEDRAINQLPSAGKQNNANLLQLLLNIAGLIHTQNAPGSRH